jgi:catechol 2,3-dioxygenase-like lactoylglutathione lyase family enzyme
MGYDLDGLLDQYDRGVISRRHLIKGMVLLTAAAFGGREGAASLDAAAPAIAPARAINHLHVNVSDLKRSEEFYAAVLGATIREREEGITTMVFPGSTKDAGCWLSLTSVTSRIGGGEGGGTPPKAGTYNHAGIGVDLKDPKRIAADVRKMFPNVKVPEATRTDQMNIYDPDGLRVQLMTMGHDGYVASEKVPDGRGGTKDGQKYKPGEHI